MIDKLRDCFDEMVVYKDLKKTNFIATLSLPSFLRDWLLKKFADEEGNVDIEEIKNFIKEYIPSKEDWVSIKNRIVYENERVKFLTKISIEINVTTQEISFSLPDFALPNKETLIEPNVWELHKNELVNGREIWGIVELGYRPPYEKVKGKILLTDFTSFRPYDIDHDYYKDARSEFTTSEWIDVILGAIDYNANGYKDETEKRAVISRLLPFVEKKLNIIELAPKGTGKSYLFGHVSKFGMLTDGGKVTRAKMFYDTARKTPGFVTGNDFVAIDEVKLVTFGDLNEMRSIMQGYMEYGMFNIGGYEGQSDAGIVFLGNIAQGNMDEYSNMFTELPPLFQESALVDRIHGFIKGWDIPRMNDDLKISGWALNSEYFCTIMHLLREDASYRAIVDQLVEVPPKSDTRDTEAVKRLCTAYLKLLFPNVRSKEDVNLREFRKYCLHPAVSMRGIIKTQMGILDEEFRGKDIPKYTISYKQVEENAEQINTVEHVNDKDNSFIQIETDERYRPVSDLRQVRYSIEDETISKKIEKVEERLETIIDLDDGNNNDVNRVINLYYPLMMEVMRKYVSLQGASKEEPENSERINNSINELLDAVEMSFSNTINNKVKGEIIDASAEVSALKMKLSMDGLLNE